MSEENLAVETVKKQKRNRNSYRVSPADFVKVWQESGSAQEVADKLGVPKHIVLARSAQYRKNNIPLKKMPRINPRKLDVDALTRIINSY